MEEVYIGLLGKPGFESNSNPQIRHNWMQPCKVCTLTAAVFSSISHLSANADTLPAQESVLSDCKSSEEVASKLADMRAQFERSRPW